MRPELIVLRDEARPYATCPNCQARLDLPALEGTRWTVRSPRDIAERLILEMGRLEREELWVALLNTKNIVLGIERVYQGNVSVALVRVGELFREAVHRHAAGLILVHYHPSGDPSPSPDDLHLTAEAVAAGRLLDVPVLDHIVIGDAYVSLRDGGSRSTGANWSLAALRTGTPSFPPWASREQG